MLRDGNRLNAARVGDRDAARREIDERKMPDSMS
jgi:hypothetical protein